MTQEELDEIKKSTKIVICDNHSHIAIPYENWYKIISVLEEHLKEE